MRISNISGAGVNPYACTRSGRKAAGAQRFEEMVQKAVGSDTLETGDGLRNISDEKETENRTDIIVKPDGSRVLVITSNIGEMKTTMSIEISKPADMQNINLNHDNENGETPVFESETGSNNTSDTDSET